MAHEHHALDQFIHLRKMGRTLVVGSKVYGDKPDRRKLYTKAVGLDMSPGEGVDIVHDLERPYQGEFEHIDLCSVLEHVRRPWLMAKNIEALMLPGATILISVPFVWRLHDYPGDYWRMSHEALEVLFPKCIWKHRAFLVEGELVKGVPKLVIDDVRYLARAETVAFGARSI